MGAIGGVSQDSFFMHMAYITQIIQADMVKMEHQHLNGTTNIMFCMKHHNESQMLLNVEKNIALFKTITIIFTHSFQGKRRKGVKNKLWWDSRMDIVKKGTL